MVTYIFFAKDSPGERDIARLAEELEHLQVETEQIEADSRKGADLCSVYDVMQRPSVVTVREDGSVAARWDGMLPLASDVSYVAHS